MRMGAGSAQVRSASAATSRDGEALPLGVRTVVVLGLASVAGLLAFGWPLILSPGSSLEHSTDAPLVLAGLLVAVLGVVFVSLSDGGIDVKAVAVLGLLSAVGAVLRPLSAGTAGVELIFVVIVLGGRVFGPGFGFALGSTTVFASALLTGGVAMNLSFWPFQLGTGTSLSFVPGAALDTNLHRFVLYSTATSLGWDLGRAVTTGLGLALVGGPILVALRRTSARAAFGDSARRAPR